MVNDRSRHGVDGVVEFGPQEVSGSVSDGQNYTQLSTSDSVFNSQDALLASSKLG